MQPFLGFAAWTPLLTPVGCKSIEGPRPGDVIQTQPDHQGAQQPEAQDDESPR